MKVVKFVCSDFCFWYLYGGGIVSEDKKKYKQKEWLKKVYLEEGKTLKEIAEMCNAGGATIYYWKNKFNL